METHYFDTPDAGPFKNRFYENQFYSSYIQYLLESFENIESKNQFLT